MKKFSSIATLIIISASFSVPLLAAAETTLNSDYCNSTGRNYDTKTQTCVSNSGGINIGVIKPYGDSLKDLINDVLVPVFMAIAFIVFLWGVFKYFIWGGDNETERETGKKFVMWGLIGFVIILSLWGIVSILMGALNLQGGKPPPIPKL